MNQNYREYHALPAQLSIHQWRWEESVNTLRRSVDEKKLRFHWTTTGTTTIDATARAYIAEWQALDVAGRCGREAQCVIDALVHRALADAPWDLYVIEGSDGSSLSARRLRDHRGFQISWLEGRCPPPTGSVVALRLAHLDPPGLWASTLPLVFGDESKANRLLLALLRSFGAHDISSWTEFMRGPGARLLVEYALSTLCQRAAEEGGDDDDDDLAALTDAFGRLERAFHGRSNEICREIHLDDGGVALLEDIACGPYLMIFDDADDLRRYRSGGDVGWCRVHRAPAEELSAVEHALGALAGLRPARDGLVRLRRRDQRGHLIDPRPTDLCVVEDACRRLAASRRRRAA